MKHNTLLHLTTAPSETHVPETGAHEETKAEAPTTIVTHGSHSDSNNSIMLSTALVYVNDNNGSSKSCRALLDCGSQANFISRSFLTTLGIKLRTVSIAISGINGTTSEASQVAKIHLKSRVNEFNTMIDCIIAERVTGRLPSFTLKRNIFKIPRSIKLADPQFHTSADVDILIVVELFWQVLCVRQIKPSPEHPILQKTRLGWILAGRLGASECATQNIHALQAAVSNTQLRDQLQQFWQVEEVENPRNYTYTTEEASCERQFLEGTSQDSEGRFSVKLPFKDGMLDKLGNSKDIATKHMLALERRFKREPELKIQYAAFLHEYRKLGHMVQVDTTRDDEVQACYLPHHSVFKGNKIRVVFDASSKNNNGVSLNDMLMTGPVVQQDLTTILMRFRMFSYAFSADIIQMYRQIRVDSSQIRYQRILWRDDPAATMQTFELTTITYGTSPASFLATRCLNYLADLYKNEFPVGSIRVQRDFYMDDLLTGADSLHDTKLIQDEIINLLKRGKFELSKWASNCPALLESLRDKNDDILTINNSKDSRILGIHWKCALDTFCFSFQAQESGDVVSKRTILSEVSKLFDPLGLLGPVIVTAKLILQKLWQTGTHWDESVPPDIHLQWVKFKTELHHLNKINVPRCVKGKNGTQKFQIHGFCDASERAYGACVYIRTLISNNKYHSELLVSKSRVAPLKALSLPRLELLAALLLAHLIDKVARSIDLTNIRMFLWSDSTIVLNWISASSRKWSTFVANRVGEIQGLTRISDWRHVASVNNPADVLSRGLNVRELAICSLWWHGPNFLEMNEEQWPNGKFNHVGGKLPEQKPLTVSITTIEDTVVEELLNKHSSLNKSCRILAYCLRLSKTYRLENITTFVSPLEIRAALDVICKNVQRQSFPEEYRALSEGKAISSTSKLLSLSPFIDAIGLIRVGGRLKNSDLNFSACHPMLLPRSHVLTKRIIEYEYVRAAHAGVQATMASIRQQFWPLALRSTTRKIIQDCIRCFKAKPVQSEAIMSTLPYGRVTVSKPFSHCGVDYAGPLVIREGKRRNSRHSKAYAAIFICFATKVVHIELVSDLTSDGFLAALKRFISRRGKPSFMYSDHGTNFVGARRQIREIYDFLNNKLKDSEIRHFLRDQGVSWSFIPPNASHCGGIWEAAVKSTKHHLARIVGKAFLTFEELQTTLCEIEAILNSRPLVPLSSDPNDLSYISPGHFLIGGPLNSLPCHDLCNINESKLIRWQRVEQLRQHFWRRWSTEYLQSLQERAKWHVNKGRQLEINQLVLLKQQGLSPLQWLLGRVQEVHTSADGNVRSATVKTASGILTRPLTKIAILPIEPD